MPLKTCIYSFLWVNGVCFSIIPFPRIFHSSLKHSSTGIPVLCIKYILSTPCLEKPLLSDGQVTVNIDCELDVEVVTEWPEVKDQVWVCMGKQEETNGESTEYSLDQISLPKHRILIQNKVFIYYNVFIPLENQLNLRLKTVTEYFRLEYEQELATV